MTLLLRHPDVPTPTPLALPGPPVEVDERAARRTLREQIARLEGELADLQMTAWESRTHVEALRAEPSRKRQPRTRLLPLAALERTRDELAAKAAAARGELDSQGEQQEHARRAREEMLLDPEKHPLARITNAQIGEPGCRDWHVRPRFGLLGMLAGWWRVVVSSGCPLSRGA
jgi:hypothetical protein